MKPSTWPCICCSWLNGPPREERPLPQVKAPTRLLMSCSPTPLPKKPLPPPLVPPLPPPLPKMSGRLIVGRVMLGRLMLGRLTPGMETRLDRSGNLALIFGRETMLARLLGMTLKTLPREEPKSRPSMLMSGSWIANDGPPMGILMLGSKPRPGRGMEMAGNTAESSCRKSPPFEAAIWLCPSDVLASGIGSGVGAGVGAGKVPIVTVKFLSGAVMSKVAGSGPPLDDGSRDCVINA